MQIINQFKYKAKTLKYKIKIVCKFIGIKNVAQQRLQFIASEQWVSVYLLT